MSGEFVYNGRSSAEFGLLVSNLNNFGAPSRVVEKVRVPYRNGDLLIDTGTYTNYTVSYEVALIHNAVVNTRELAAWLLTPQGYCELTDSYNVGETRYAAFYGDLNYTMTHLNMYGRATLSFDCKPQRYLDSGKTPISVSGTQIITNPTDFVAKPLITVRSAGTFYIENYEVTINNSRVSSSQPLTIDCESMQCKWGVMNVNNDIEMPQGFPVLLPGENVVDTDTVSGLVITPRWWRL